MMSLGTYLFYCQKVKGQCHLMQKSCTAICFLHSCECRLHLVMIYYKW